MARCRVQQLSLSLATLSARQGGRGGNKKHFALNELHRTQQVRLLEDRFRCKTNKTPSDVSSYAGAFIGPEVVKLQKSKPKSLKVRRLRAVLLSALHIITACILGAFRRVFKLSNRGFHHLGLRLRFFLYPFFL